MRDRSIRPRAFAGPRYWRDLGSRSAAEVLWSAHPASNSIPAVKTQNFHIRTPTFRLHRLSYISNETFSFRFLRFAVLLQEGFAAKEAHAFLRIQAQGSITPQQAAAGVTDLQGHFAIHPDGHLTVGQIHSQRQGVPMTCLDLHTRGPRHLEWDLNPVKSAEIQWTRKTFIKPWLVVFCFMFINS